MQTLTHLEDRGQAATVSKSNTTNKTELGVAFRYCDDIGPRQAAAIAANLGGEPARILEAGYGLATVNFARSLQRKEAMKHGTIVLPCRNVAGEIVGIHDHRLEWLTAPAVHIANPARARFAEIKLTQTTAEADSIALAENVCVIAQNGCDDRAVESAVLAVRLLGTAGHPHILKRAQKREEWEMAA